MSDGGDWGPWIDHDGRGFPVPIGTVVHRVFDAPVDHIDGNRVQSVGEIIDPLKVGELDSWLWVLARRHPYGQIARVVRYRVRQSRGMEVLKGLLQSAPEEVCA